MMIQFTVFVPAVIAIYAATGAWVFSCDPISKTVDVVRGGLLYGWVGDRGEIPDKYGVTLLWVRETSSPPVSLRLKLKCCYSVRQS